MKIKKKVILMGMVLLFFLVSCKQSDTNTKVIQNYRSGYDGIEMRFLDNAPPSEIYYTSPAAQGEQTASRVPIGIEIRDKGAEKAYGVLSFNLDGYTDIKPSSVDTVPYSSTNVYRIGDINNGYLEGRRKENPNGDIRIFTVLATPAPLSPQAEQFKSTIIATACYNYRTEFDPEVCIDTDIYNMKVAGKVCKVADVSGGGGQGGPVAVDNVEVSMLPRDNGVVPHFTLTIRNSGNGEVLVFGKDKDVCSQAAPGSKSTNFNIVRVSAFMGDKGIVSLTCYPKKNEIFKDAEGYQEGEYDFGYARLTDKVGTVICSYNGVLPPDKQGNYVAKARFVLDYAYTTSISKEVLIKVPLPKNRIPIGAGRSPQPSDIPIETRSGYD